MKLFKREFGHVYNTYSFGYTCFAELGHEEDPELAYSAGYLPYSGDPAIHNQFYMARSVRIPVHTYTPSSENRRIFRKFDGQFTYTYLTPEQALQEDGFETMFLEYFEKRHGAHIMSHERLTGIIQTILPLRVVRYSRGDTPVGYVLEVTHPSFSHYWFSAYDLSLIDASLGMWLMLDSLRRAQEEKRTHVYIGTAYGQKGKYKMNISPLEFWDGTIWNSDKELVRALTNGDNVREAQFPS